MPDGNYDIFIIPPHSAGSGFLYLPSMQPHRNSFLAGVACTLFAVGIWTLVLPVIRHWLDLVMSGGGGLGVVVLVIAVGVGAWTWGKTQAENSTGPGSGGSSSGHGQGGSQRQYSQHSNGPPPNYHAPPPQPGPPPQPDPPPQPKAQPDPKARTNPSAGAWEKAREETRKREEERKRAEELKKKREEAQKMREETEKAAKAKAEKDKWEQARAREKEAREREARERIARERLAREKETREKDAREREAREKAEKDKKAQSAPSARSSPTKAYEKPTAKSAAGESYSYRPYDSPRAAKTATYKSSASSISGVSESYAPSQSTARTTPPPSHRGPYSTNEEGKIQIKAVYLFSDIFPTKPISQLIANQGHVTDGLILRIQTEGLFIDDDVRGVPQREWDVKAWTLKLLEDGVVRTASGAGLHVFRATTRDTENKKYTFVLDESEAWKVALGISRLRKGSQVRSLGMNGMKENEVKGLLMSLGWM
ncbi:hypothetical protein PRZ48_001993 [Zasmidium cellare]|uniref:Uncharacterized protein n=1 Tax=Zasmidium cellare TaxID=395010 RepID=A0ABR0F4D8_ZASCE|nr:hypothetical protein PRZ48_001993 [Zasmidium cellare]